MPRGSAANTEDPEPDDGEIEFELVTSVRQLAAPPPLRHEAVTLDEWKTANGRAARFMLWELTALDYADFYEEGRIYRDGVITGYDAKAEDIRFLAYTIRDQHNNRLWTKVADARAQLGNLGKASLNVLLNAANRCNAPKESSAEGNSSETQSDS
jgi:hypothetical protein